MSLVSLGVGYIFTPFNSLYSLNSSFYYSTVSSPSNQVNNSSSSIEIPGEYGLTFYGVYSPIKSQVSYFGGIDFESFSSFNLQNITTNGAITIDNNTITYLTAGFNFRPDFINKLNLKLSYSKSLISTYTSAAATDNDVKISGFKFSISTSYQLNKNWSVNAIFKSHNFGGDNDLSISRFGLGVSYLIF